MPARTCPYASSLRCWAISPSTTPGPRRRVPSASGSVPGSRRAASSCRSRSDRRSQGDRPRRARGRAGRAGTSRVRPPQRSSRTTTSPLRVCGSELETKLPRLVRLLDRAEPLDAPADRLLHVLRLLLLAALAVAALLPLLHPPQLLLEPGLLALVRAVRLRLAAQRVIGACLLVLAPAACELRRVMRPLVQLDDALDRAVEEVTVV